MTTQLYHVSDYFDNLVVNLENLDTLDEIPDLLLDLVFIDGVCEVRTDGNIIAIDIEDDDCSVYDRIEEVLDITDDWCDLESLDIRGSESVVVIDLETS